MASGFYRTPAVGGGVGEDFQDVLSIYPGAIRRVCVLGHSYVDRIIVDEYVYEPHFTVTPCAAPGATVDNIRQSAAWREFERIKPDLTFLVLGGNDIHEDTNPGDLARKIEVLAKEVEERSGGSVVIIGIEKRQYPHGLSASRFNNLRNRVNRFLKGYIIWTRTRYQSMCTSASDFAVDGVHLHEEAQKDMFKMLLDKAREHFADDEKRVHDRLVEAMREHIESKPESN